jgi:hypothetical protein
VDLEGEAGDGGVGEEALVEARDRGGGVERAFDVDDGVDASGADLGGGEWGEKEEREQMAHEGSEDYFTTSIGSRSLPVRVAQPVTAPS